jgi:hypothetical protein
MTQIGIQPQRRAQESRTITSVSLIAGSDHAVFPVSPKPFVYRPGMRLRIDIIGASAFVSETA